VIFNQLLSGHLSSEFRLVTYPVPYALVQLIISSILLIFSPMVTSKIMAALYALLVFLAICRLISKAKLDPLIGWAFFISVVAINAPFWNGYMGSINLVLPFCFSTFLSRLKPARKS